MSDSENKIRQAIKPITDLLDDWDDCLVEESIKAILQHFQQEQETTLKQGFYAGQANAGIKLEEAHKNWKEWSGYMLSNLKDKGGV